MLKYTKVSWTETKEGGNDIRNDIPIHELSFSDYESILTFNGRYLRDDKVRGNGKDRGLNNLFDISILKDVEGYSDEAINAMFNAGLITDAISEDPYNDLNFYQGVYCFSVLAYNYRIYAAIILGQVNRKVTGKLKFSSDTSSVESKPITITPTVNGLIYLVESGDTLVDVNQYLHNIMTYPHNRFNDAIVTVMNLSAAILANQFENSIPQADYKIIPIDRDYNISISTDFKLELDTQDLLESFSSYYDGKSTAIFRNILSKIYKVTGISSLQSDAIPVLKHTYKIPTGYGTTTTANKTYGDELQSKFEDYQSSLVNQNLKEIRQDGIPN